MNGTKAIPVRLASLAFWSGRRGKNENKLPKPIGKEKKKRRKTKPGAFFLSQKKGGKGVGDKGKIQHRGRLKEEFLKKRKGAQKSRE